MFAAVDAGRHLPAGVSESSSAHLERLEASRQLFTAAGALSTAQRQLLYAHDELAMAVLRIETRMAGEQVRAAHCYCCGACGVLCETSGLLTLLGALYGSTAGGLI